MERQRWASFILICALLISLQKSTFDHPTPEPLYSSALGEHKSIAMADGSNVQLNTNTLASVEINTRSRAVTIRHGEALLRIAADPRPFVIHLGATDFETSEVALAHVRLDPDGVTEVDVLKGEGWIRPAAATVHGRFQPLRVSAGNSFSLHDDVRIVQQFDPSEMTRKLAWTLGQIVLAGEPLRDAVAEFNRYNRRQLLVGDESIANLPTGGTFYVTEPDTFTRSLSQLFGIRAVRMRPSTPATADAVMLVGGSYSGL